MGVARGHYFSFHQGVITPYGSYQRSVISILLYISSSFDKFQKNYPINILITDRTRATSRHPEQVNVCVMTS